MQLSARTLRNLKLGDEVSLTIDTHVREDAIRLYGFQSEIERNWFRTLQGVQGAGSKVALGVLGVLSTQDLANAIALGNWAAVRAGAGRRQEAGATNYGRVEGQGAGAVGCRDCTFRRLLPGGNVDEMPASGIAAAEAVSALTNLGYNPAQASAAVAAAVKELGAETDTAKLIRRGLKELAR